MKFDGTQNYVATEDLKIAVNAAVTLERNFMNGTLSQQLKPNKVYMSMTLFHA